jgi:crotonobetainyl-CoA:carnitine CoA-transferase CaiB-like acyl-CoA transferase
VKAAPLLGADNEQVYGDVLGISPERLAELKKQGVV